MATINIPFSALSLNSSEASAPNGTLARSSALLTEHARGGLQPIFPPSAAKTPAGGDLLLPAGTTLSCIHATALYKHLIITGSFRAGSDYVAWLHDDGTTTTLIDGLASVTTITAVGNTLVILAADAVHYLLYRPTAGRYEDLGTHIPMLPVSFTLNSEYRMQYVQNAGIKVTDRKDTTDDAGRTIIGSLVFKLDSPQSYEPVNYSDSTVFRFDGSDPKPAYHYDPALIFAPAENSYAIRFKTALGDKYPWYVFLTGTRVGDTSGERVTICKINFHKTGNINPDDANTFFADKNAKYNNLHLVVWTTENRAHTAYLLRADGAYTPKIVDQSTDAALNAILGACNRFVRDEATDRERFCFPFYVRAGLRLFDGSIYPLADPVLLLPATGPAPHVYYTDSDTVTLYVAGVVSRLLYRLLPDAGAATLAELRAKWRDVVTGLVVGVSQPIYTYNQGAEWAKDKDLLPVTLAAKRDPKSTDGPTFYDSDSGISVSRFDGIAAASSFAAYDYSADLFRAGFGASFTGNVYSIAPPTFTDEQLRDNLLSTSAYYVAAEIELDKLPTDGGDRLEGFSALPIKRGALATLATREAVPDAYLSRCTLAATSAYAYSSRLNLAGVTEHLAPALPVPMLGGYELTDVASITDVYVRLDTPDGYRYVHTDLSASYLGTGLRWYYYPDSRAKEALVIGQVLSTVDNIATHAIVAPRLVTAAARIDLTRHDLMQGAYWWDDYGNIPLSPAGLTVGWDDLDSRLGADCTPDDVQSILAAAVLPDTVKHPAEVYTSEVDNPWLYPATGRNQVGSGRVLTIVSNATALTQEQYGSHPLYAFCTDGVWALAQSDTGNYVQVQPVSRNILLSPSAIVQLDTSIAYCTSRGVYLLSGLRSECISEPLIDASSASIDTLPGFGTGGPFAAPHVPLSDYLGSAALAYDYLHQRIWLTSAAYDLSLVYSLRSSTWATLPASYGRVVNAYPDAYMQGTGANRRRLYSLMSAPSTIGTDGDRTQPVILVTRPCTLDDASILTTPRVVTIRGDVSPRQVSLALYGARTLGRWHLLGSVRGCNTLHLRSGSPYRYYRIAVLARLNTGQSIEGATITAIRRDTNQQR